MTLSQEFLSAAAENGAAEHPAGGLSNINCLRSHKFSKNPFLAATGIGELTTTN
jgi:hypothetical protein